MRIFAVTVGLVAFMGALTALPLIPELIAVRQGLLVALGLGGVVLILRNAWQRWVALPDLRVRVVLWSLFSVLLCSLGGLTSLFFSPLPGDGVLCSVRATRLAQAPTGYPELHPDRTTYRFQQNCIPDGQEVWLQQSVLIFQVGPTVADRG